MHDSNSGLEQHPILLSPSPEEIAQLTTTMRRHLTRIGLSVEERQLHMLTTLTRILMPDLPLDALVPAVMQAIWVYRTDALVDRCTACRDLERRLRMWQAPTAGDGLTDPEHRLLRGLYGEVATRASSVQLAGWWAAACQFLDAQLAQRCTAAASYLGYLAMRPVAQAIPLTISLAAILYDCSPQLEQARTAELLWWAGCYMGLSNDLASYQRELAEGVAATANARGVLDALTTQNGSPIDAQATEALVRSDMETAWNQLTTTLGPRESWRTIDEVIARFAHLLHSGAAQ